VRQEPGLVAVDSFQSQSQGGGAPVSGGPSRFLAPDASGGGNWWPAGLGAPASVGAQNDVRYAYFPAARRLAIDLQGHVTVYDTQDHRIGGFSQQQPGSGSFAFTSQLGTVDIARLPVVSSPAHPAPAADAAPAARSVPPADAAPAARSIPPAGPAPAARPAPAADPAPAARSAPPVAPGVGAGHENILAAIERLADLHARGILTEAEFTAKKTELLGRL
jgi:hypothetical protein